MARGSITGLGAASLVQLTSDPGYEGEPTFSPDGETIAYASDRSGDLEIYLQQVAGGEAINLTRHPGDDAQPAFSPDGRQIAFVSTRSSATGPHLSHSTASADGRRHLGDAGARRRAAADRRERQLSELVAGRVGDPVPDRRLVRQPHRRRPGDRRRAARDRLRAAGRGTSSVPYLPALFERRPLDRLPDCQTRPTWSPPAADRRVVWCRGSGRPGTTIRAPSCSPTPSRARTRACGEFPSRSPQGQATGPARAPNLRARRRHPCRGGAGRWADRLHRPRRVVQPGSAAFRRRGGPRARATAPAHPGAEHRELLPQLAGREGAGLCREARRRHAPLADRPAGRPGAAHCRPRIRRVPAAMVPRWPVDRSSRARRRRSGRRRPACG